MRRLEEDIRLGEHRQLLLHKRSVESVGNHKNVVNGNYVLHTVERHLDKRATGAKEINKLFWEISATIRPESATDSATHNYAISVVGSHGDIL